MGPEMAKIHGKNVFVSLDGDDLSTFANNVEYSGEADTHETTCFGKNSKTYQGGLKDGTATISGIYDSDVTGPRAVIKPLLGSTVEYIYRPEGTGTGKPQDTVDVVVQSYEETAPVGDMIAWSCEVQFTDDVTTAAQA